MVAPAPEIAAEGHRLRQRARQLLGDRVRERSSRFEAVSTTAQVVRVRAIDRLAKNGDELHTWIQRPDATWRVQ